MIVSKTSSQLVRNDQNTDSMARAVNVDLTTLFQCLQGRTRFGPGVSGRDGENIAGQWLQVTTNGTPNTESSFTHSIGATPIGYIPIWQDKAGSLYQGPTTGTAWTTTSISLKCSVASVTFLLFLLK